MTAERAQHILVIGIGNAERGDDGVGLAVAERVSALGLSKVDVAKHCGDACALMEAWEGYGNVILVDATRSGAMAGTARLATMQSAHQAIEEKLRDLQRDANVQRQEEITTELLDIVTGTEALQGLPAEGS